MDGYVGRGEGWQLCQYIVLSLELAVNSNVSPFNNTSHVYYPSALVLGDLERSSVPSVTIWCSFASL